MRTNGSSIYKVLVPMPERYGLFGPATSSSKTSFIYYTSRAAVLVVYARSKRLAEGWFDLTATMYTIVSVSRVSVSRVSVSRVSVSRVSVSRVFASDRDPAGSLWLTWFKWSHGT